MLKIKKDRKPKEKQYLGVDPLRDSSLLSAFYWAGLRVAEIVGDRKRTYKVSRFTKPEREEMKRKGIDWRKEPEPYINRTSPERPGILKEDIEFDEETNFLYIRALALKHGKRENPLELSLKLPYVDLILQQWERTKPGEKVWDLRTEYAWAIIKELDVRLYPHYYRFNRTMETVELPNTSAADLLSWFGWRRVQTAYNYLELGVKSIKKTSVAMVEKYTGEKVEVSPTEEVVEEPLVEEKPFTRKIPQKSSKIEKSKKKSAYELLKEVSK